MPLHSNKDWKTRDWEFMQEIRDQQSEICDQIIQKRNQRLAIERNLSAIISEIKALEDRHSDLEAEARQIGKRIHTEPSIADLRSVFENQVYNFQPRRGGSLNGTQTVSSRRVTIEASSQTVQEYLIYRPVSSSQNRKSPDSPTSRGFLVFPPSDTSSTGTLVERQEETPLSNYFSPMSTSNSPTDPPYYFDKSPRNSDSKSGTPLVDVFRKRTQSFRSGIVSRPPFASSSAGPSTSVPQHKQTPNRASVDGKYPKRF